MALGIVDFYAFLLLRLEPMCSEYIIIFDAYNTLKDPTWAYIKSILFSSLPSVLELPLKRWIAVATTIVPT